MKNWVRFAVTEDPRDVDDNPDIAPFGLH